MPVAEQIAESRQSARCPLSVTPETRQEFPNLLPWPDSYFSMLLGHRQSQSSHRHLVERRLAILLGGDAEVAGIIPHGPADIVALERGAHVGDPCGAVFRIREITKYAELVADQRHAVLLGPLGG